MEDSHPLVHGKPTRHAEPLGLLCEPVHGAAGSGLTASCASATAASKSRRVMPERASSQHSPVPSTRRCWCR